MKKILFVFGTRPEAIKLAPLIYKFKSDINKFDVKVCVTGQHREMLDQVLQFFNILPDYDLDLMKQGQSLFDITSQCLVRIENILVNENPHIVIVQGDTTTAFVAALAAYYKHIKIVHIEAGLRTYNKYSPFPEEMNRVLISRLADWHFAPTQKARQNLESEGINKDIFVVGNTVIDALFLALSIIDRKGEEEYYRYFRNLNIDLSKKIILVTSHRRESFGEPIKNICIAIKEIAQAFSDIEIIYPVHFNPNIRNIVREILQYQDRIHLIEPLDYSYMIWLMKMSYIILTDSGGIQEEAPSLNKPVLIMREVTERTEGIENGVSMLVGTKKEDIVKATSMLINDNQKYNLMINKPNPYGDGMASSKIVNYLLETS